MDNFSEITKSLLGQVHVKSSVLNPLLWLTGLSGVICFPAAYFIPPFAGFLVTPPIVCFICTIIAYAYFAFKDPDRLQSEEYQIQQQKMQYQLMQGSQKVEIIADGRLVANPALLQTSPPSGGNQ